MNTQLTDADFISFCSFTAHYCHPPKKGQWGRDMQGTQSTKKGTEVAEAHWMTLQVQGSSRAAHFNEIPKSVTKVLPDKM